MSSTTRGIDLSSFQGAQDFAKHHADGVRFVFMKASEGMHSHDPHYALHMAGARKAGMVVGAYHFGWPCQNVDSEAQNYIAAVRADAEKQPGFVHWLDLEPYPDHRNYAGRSAAQIKAWAVTWVSLVQHAFPHQRVGVYGGYGEYSAGHVPAGVPSWFPAYPWTAGTWAQAEAHPRPSAGGRPVDFWQFTSKPNDRSLCYLTEASLRAWTTGLQPKPKPTPAPLPTRDPFPKSRVYTVRSGDTLSAIAAHFHSTVQKIASTNHIKDVNKIYVGQVLHIPN